jgi:soluble lytic murein transglycosylase-like protein
MKYAVTLTGLLALLAWAAPAKAEWPPVWKPKPPKEQKLVAENRRLKAHVRNFKLWTRKLMRENKHLRRHSNWYAESVQAIRMASIAYGVSEGMLRRKADCESGLWPYAANPSSDATGLFQFMPGTFRSTPFARFSIWDIHAQSLAAAWMHKNGRGREWACR